MLTSISKVFRKFQKFFVTFAELYDLQSELDAFVRLPFLPLEFEELTIIEKIEPIRMPVERNSQIFNLKQVILSLFSWNDYIKAAKIFFII